MFASAQEESQKSRKAGTGKENAHQNGRQSGPQAYQQQSANSHGGFGKRSWNGHNKQTAYWNQNKGSKSASWNGGTFKKGRRN